jgi:hypothetical protein
MIETQGSVSRTLEEEKKLQVKREMMRRSNDRLKMIEDMEK